MKTDLQKLIDLLTEFGVGYTTLSNEMGTCITCEWGASKVTGYVSFYTTFDFDKNGKFIEMGAWE